MKNVDEATFVKYLYSVKVHSLAFHMGLELSLEPKIKLLPASAALCALPLTSRQIHMYLAS